jgi:precorrin-3B methylase
MLLKARTGDTPVGVVKNASKPDEQVVFTTLKGLDAESVDMKCTVIIGNSQTRRVGRWLLTPRGYAAKYDLTKQNGE